VIALSREAEDHVDRLIAHYEELARPRAAEKLLEAIERAKLRISKAPGAGLEAPRPYPMLKKAGRRWIKEGSYWIAYRTTKPPVIAGIYYATVDIPRWV
jgi:plasmid stabilization system protein ParE